MKNGHYQHQHQQHAQQQQHQQHGQAGQGVNAYYGHAVGNGNGY